MTKISTIALAFAGATILSAAVAAMPAHAYPPLPAGKVRLFWSGSKLFEVCKQSQDVCGVYILGVSDSLGDIYSPTGEKVCLPSGTTDGQVVAVATKYLRDHPERWHYGAASLVAESFMAAFPCTRP